MTPRPTLVLIATGGTIAAAAASATDTTGYAAGTLPAEALLAAVPAIGDVAEIRVEQLFNMDSRDMGPAHWVTLAKRTRAVLDEPGVAGVVITHGTDTLEESAAFLDATVTAQKPVVLTGAIRPATALSADGPVNLYDAVCVAAHPASAGRGVLVSFGGAILPAAGLRKADTTSPNTFRAAPGGPVGRTDPVHYFAPPPARPAPLALPESAERLPRVDVLYVAAGTPPEALGHAVASGARGVVLALAGNGSVPLAWREGIARAVAAGVPVVRASRVGAGPVTPHADDAELGTLPAGDRPPSAMRVLLMLVLAQAEASS